jgi:hypothetical protein
VSSEVAPDRGEEDPTRCNQAASACSATASPTAVTKMSAAAHTGGAVPAMMGPGGRSSGDQGGARQTRTTPMAVAPVSV